MSGRVKIRWSRTFSYESDSNSDGKPVTLSILMGSKLIEITTVVGLRFLSKFDEGRKFECWPWLGGRGDEGYGRVYAGKAPLKAHRVSWVLSHGCDVPSGMVVMHTCDNPTCVNPAHLVAAPQRANVMDSFQKGRRKQPVPNKWANSDNPLVRARAVGISPSRVASTKALSVKQVMKRTNFSRARVYRLMKANKITAVREGKGSLHILEESLEAYFDQARRALPAPSQDAQRRAADAAFGETSGRFS